MARRCIRADRIRIGAERPRHRDCDSWTKTTKLLGDPWVDAIGLAKQAGSKTSLRRMLEADLAQFLGRAMPRPARRRTKLHDGLKAHCGQSQ